MTSCPTSKLCRGYMHVYVLKALWWGIDTIDSMDTFFLFFYVRLQFRRMDNLFFVEKNLIKVSCVPWKHFLLFSINSVFLKPNFSENFLKNLVQISIQFYLSIVFKFQLQFTQNSQRIFSFLQDFRIFPLISITSQHFPNQLTKFSKIFLKISEFFFLIFRLFFKFYLKFIIFLKNFSKY